MVQHSLSFLVTLVSPSSTLTPSWIEPSIKQPLDDDVERCIRMCACVLRGEHREAGGGYR
jgi:hypothetical protein